MTCRIPSLWLKQSCWSDIIEIYWFQNINEILVFLFKQEAIEPVSRHNHTKTVTGDRLNIGYFPNERLSTFKLVQFHKFVFYLHVQKTLSHISLTRMHKYKWNRTLCFYGCNPVIVLNYYLIGKGVLPRCQWNKLIEIVYSIKTYLIRHIKAMGGQRIVVKIPCIVVKKSRCIVGWNRNFCPCVD